MAGPDPTNILAKGLVEEVTKTGNAFGVNGSVDEGWLVVTVPKDPDKIKALDDLIKDW